MVDDLEELLGFYDYPVRAVDPSAHDQPIDSTFATVPHRTKVTKGPGSRAAGLAMAFNSSSRPRPAGAG